MIDHRTLPLFPELEAVVLPPPRPHRSRVASRRSTMAVERLRGDVVVRSLETRDLLNRCDNPRLPFAWTLNPYRGCEFACSFCHARPTHEYLGYPRQEVAGAFEKEIWAKVGWEPSLEPERLARAATVGPIAVGTATDPWQPAEEKLQVTRRVLVALSRATGLDLSFSTRSPLVARDVELLAEIAGRSRLVVRISISTVDPELSRRIEPRAPSPIRRLETIRSLAAAGIDVRLGLAPIVPLIADSEGVLAAVVEAARNAGAAGADSNPLFFPAGWWGEGWTLLAARFPELRGPLLAFRDYPKSFASVRATLQARAARIIHDLGLDGDPIDRRPSAADETEGWLFSPAEALPEHRRRRARLPRSFRG